MPTDLADETSQLLKTVFKGEIVDLDPDEVLDSDVQSLASPISASLDSPTDLVEETNRLLEAVFSGEVVDLDPDDMLDSYTDIDDASLDGSDIAPADSFDPSVGKSYCPMMVVSDSDRRSRLSKKRHCSHLRIQMSVYGKSHACCTRYPRPSPFV